MVKHTNQKGSNECGIACLKMFFDLFGVEKTYDELLNEVNIIDDGVAIEDMLKSLNNLALFKAYEIKKENLKFNCPSIVLLKNNNKYHYIVVWKYENSYFFISDPINSDIVKIKENKLLKLFSNYIIFNQKREIEIPKKQNFKIKSSGYRVPYIILSILEVFLLTYSMLYLFSIKDFTILKIYTFLIILFINCIISLIKNLCFNVIQKTIDKKTIDLKIKENFINNKINNVISLKNNIQKGYTIKNNYVNLLTRIIPSILIILGSLIYYYFINKWIFIASLIILLLVLSINCYFSFKKNKYMKIGNLEELKINAYENKILSIKNKEEIIEIYGNIKNISAKILIYTQVNSLVNFAIKQFCLMVILIFMYISKIDVYSIFVITFYFYSFDGIINLSEYLVMMKDNNILKKSFLTE